MLGSGQHFSILYRSLNPHGILYQDLIIYGQQTIQLVTQLTNLNYFTQNPILRNQLMRFIHQMPDLATQLENYTERCSYYRRENIPTKDKVEGLTPVYWDHQRDASTVREEILNFIENNDHYVTQENRIERKIDESQVNQMQLSNPVNQMPLDIPFNNKLELTCPISAGKVFFVHNNTNFTLYPELKISFPHLFKVSARLNFKIDFSSTFRKSVATHKQDILTLRYKNYEIKAISVSNPKTSFVGFKIGTIINHNNMNVKPSIFLPATKQGLSFYWENSSFNISISSTKNLILTSDYPNVCTLEPEFSIENFFFNQKLLKNNVKPDISIKLKEKAQTTFITKKLKLTKTKSSNDSNLNFFESFPNIENFTYQQPAQRGLLNEPRINEPRIFGTTCFAVSEVNTSTNNQREVTTSVGVPIDYPMSSANRIGPGFNLIFPLALLIGGFLVKWWFGNDKNKEN